MAIKSGVCIKKGYEKIVFINKPCIPYIACNDEKKYSNKEVDTRDHNRETKIKVGDRGIVTDSTTSTLNNNAYNMDSENGQGNRFDTSGNNKVK